MRTLVVGDIHGAFRALEQALDRCNYDPASDKLILLGDYVDGWSESFKVIDFLDSLHEKGSDIICIRGNHDDWMLDFIDEGMTVAPHHWVNQGGMATLKSYNAHIQQNMSDYYIPEINIPKTHIDFLKDTKLFHIDEQNRGFVHGGYMSFEGLGNDPDSVYMWDRDVADMIATRSKDPVPRVLRAHNELYIGHTSTLFWKKTVPMNRNNKYFNLDTGAGWNGKLSIMDIDTKEYWQSDLSKELYPEEKGR